MAAAKLPRTFDATLLTEENKNKLRIKFNQKSIEIGGCRVWNGAKNSSGYPQTKVDWICGSVALNCLLWGPVQEINHNQKELNKQQVQHHCYHVTSLRVSGRRY